MGNPQPSPKAYPFKRVGTDAVHRLNGGGLLSSVLKTEEKGPKI